MCCYVLSLLHWLVFIQSLKIADEHQCPCDGYKHHKSCYFRCEIQMREGVGVYRETMVAELFWELPLFDSAGIPWSIVDISDNSIISGMLFLDQPTGPWDTPMRQDPFQPQNVCVLVTCKSGMRHLITGRRGSDSQATNINERYSYWLWWNWPRSSRSVIDSQAWKRADWDMRNEMS